VRGSKAAAERVTRVAEARAGDPSCPARLGTRGRRAVGEVAGLHHELGRARHQLGDVHGIALGVDLRLEVEYLAR
jgi:hypothetical protein